MKFGSYLAAAALAMTLAACASSGTTNTAAATSAEGASAAAAESESANEKGKSAVYAADLKTTRDAAIAALKLTGFDIKSSEDTLITGSRPHKMGLVVGSGGEKISVRLAAEGETSTKARVRTEKTFVGFAGQKNWDDAVINAMNESLGAS